MYAPRTRATSLPPRPIRGLFWLLDDGTGALAFAQCMECISYGTASVAQTAAFAVCGSSLGSRFRNRGQAPVIENYRRCKARAADPKNEGPRYTNTSAGGAAMHRGAPRTRAISLSPHPIRGRFWLMWHRHSCPCVVDLSRHDLSSQPAYCIVAIERSVRPRGKIGVDAAISSAMLVRQGVRR